MCCVSPAFRRNDNPYRNCRPPACILLSKTGGACHVHDGTEHIFRYTLEFSDTVFAGAGGAVIRDREGR